ncbi:hypothetical protein F8S13_18000 [Chloroflexia bacterium SDU3-3]|nr:hypothetical protein F8S13_18000 [Chloroflexia bacterium SDU3-3]
MQAQPPERRIALKLFLALICVIGGWTVLENAVFPSFSTQQADQRGTAQPERLARATAAPPSSTASAVPPTPTALPTAPSTLPTVAPAATGEAAPPAITIVAGPPAANYNPTFRNDGQLNRVSPAFWPCKSGQIKADNAALRYFTPQHPLYDATFNNVTCYETAEEAQKGGFTPGE